MIDRINEELVLQAAKEWAARLNKSGALAEESAQQTITALKAKLTGDEYSQALEQLYREYNES
ncbi:hypothetical protein [Pseudomonas sp. Sample_16]|uniref:hypothetical protein n=1 Tax=Pseudomonas sp. Sample_16 TaxID=2448263 RepID=UPI001032DA20|nr:hypothetical protein [Pseudomonas sp. Sample_16]